MNKCKHYGDVLQHINVLHLGTESCPVCQPGPARPFGKEEDSTPDEDSTMYPSHIASWDMLNWTVTLWTGHAGMGGRTT